MPDPVTPPPAEDPDAGRKALLGRSAVSKRTRIIVQIVVAFIAVVVLLVLIFGGGKSVPQDRVESFLTDGIRGNADTADCPGRLKGKKDASIVCTVKSGGRSLRVRVVVAAVDGDRVRLVRQPAG